MPRPGLAGLPLQLAPIRGVRLYEAVIDALAAFVGEGRLGPDGRFPPERELELALRVSRPVLREAFRVLEAHGFVESRQGGGRTLLGARLPTNAELRRSKLEATAENLMALWDARSAVESRAAELAATQASPADLDAIAATLAVMGRMTPDDYRATEYSLEFHVAVARASGNPFLLRAVLDLIAASREIGFKDLIEPQTFDALQDDHRPILDAIMARDGAAARLAMGKHFDGLRRALLRGAGGDNPAGASS
jgi:GntR family transcriptional regulator, transcriptional repressor for pyruvate dehydrogenase complex